MAKDKTKRVFELLPNCGDHFEPNPDFNSALAEDDDNLRHVHYVAGEKVTTTRPLDKIFVNKFKQVSGEPSDSQTMGGETPDPKAAGKDRPVRSTEDAIKSAADRYLTEEELEGKPDQKKLIKAKPEDDDESDNGDAEDEDESGKSDVTSDFEGAKDGGMEVFKDSDGHYFVHEKGEDAPMQGSKKGFTTKSKVLAFIKKNTGEE